MKEDQVLSQFQQLPDNLKQEVLDFIGYLFEKHRVVVPKQPQNNKKLFGKYRGSLKSGLSIQELDAQLLKIRNEWERPIS